MRATRAGDVPIMNITLDPAVRDSFENPNSYDAYFASLSFDQLLALARDEMVNGRFKEIAKVYLFKKVGPITLQLQTARSGEEPRNSEHAECQNAITVISGVDYDDQMLPRGCIIFQVEDGMRNRSFVEDYCYPAKIIFHFQEILAPISCELGRSIHLFEDGLKLRLIDHRHDGPDGVYLMFKYAAPNDSEERHPLTIRYKRLDDDDLNGRRFRFHSISAPLEVISFVLRLPDIVDHSEDLEYYLPDSAAE